MAKRPRIHPGRDASPGVTKRPEDKRGGDANAHYDRDEAARYTSQNDKVQRELTECALDLLVLQPAERVGPLLIADIGCGSGLSSEVIKARGHVSVGLDASQAMLERGEGAATGAVLRGDFGQGLPFRERCFDGVVSISAAQWLCQGDDEAAIDARLRRFFGSLHTMLRPGARACLQVYPRDVRETRRMERAMQAARLIGCAVTAFPHSNNAKKIFLCCVRDPRPTIEDNERYWTGFKQGYAQEGANALSEFITRTHHYMGVQSEGVECFPMPGTITSMPLGITSGVRRTSIGTWTMATMRCNVRCMRYAARTCESTLSVTGARGVRSGGRTRPRASERGSSSCTTTGYSARVSTGTTKTTAFTLTLKREIRQPVCAASRCTSNGTGG